VSRSRLQRDQPSRSRGRLAGQGVSSRERLPERDHPAVDPYPLLAENRPEPARVFALEFDAFFGRRSAHCEPSLHPRGPTSTTPGSYPSTIVTGFPYLRVWPRPGVVAPNGPGRRRSRGRGEDRRCRRNPCSLRVCYVPQIELLAAVWDSPRSPHIRLGPVDPVDTAGRPALCPRRTCRNLHVILPFASDHTGTRFQNPSPTALNG
jgi:hypothetical protein